MNTLLVDIGDLRNIMVILCYLLLSFIATISIQSYFVRKYLRQSRVQSVLQRCKRFRHTLKRQNSFISLHQFTGKTALIFRRLQLLKVSQFANIAIRLNRAGIRGHRSVIIYLSAKIILPVFTALAVCLYYYVYEVNIFYYKNFFVMIFLSSLSTSAPNLYVSNLTTRRLQSLQRALPDTLDLLVICAEAGLTLDASLNYVIKELYLSAPEMADELSVTSMEINFLPERRSALQNLAQRVDIPNIRAIVAIFIQTEKYGTPLAQSLRYFSEEIRTRIILKAEEKAGRLPAILTIPMIVFILPSLFIVLIGPAIINILSHISK